MDGKVKKIVLTGGPGAGKTVAARNVAARLGPHVRFIPEAATQVYERLGRRWTDLNLDERRAAQRAMYDLQLEQETLAEAQARRDGITLLILDRGTIDGAGYWPDGPEKFWQVVGTTQTHELARYCGVIWLETAAALGLYDHDASNAVRFENAPEAIASGDRMADLWAEHPKVIRINAKEAFEEKLAHVEQAVRSFASE